MERPDATAIQRKLFQHIIARSGERSAIPMLCELLHLNKSSVYNRINGEKLLRADELFLLANVSGFHLDQYISPDAGAITFQFGFLNAPVRSCQQYLEGVLSSFQLFSSIADMRVWLSVNALPFFHLMNFRELALFKAFAYARLNWQLPYTENLVFNPETFPERMVYEKCMQPILRLYAGLPTIEFWPDELYQTTLKQLQFFTHSGQLTDRSLKRTLVDQLHALCDHQYAMAKQGQKWIYGEKRPENAGKLDLYHNEIAPLNFTLLAESRSLKGVFTVYDDPNFMFSDDKAIYDYTLSSMTRLKTKCLHISEDSEQNRRAYFHRIREGIGEGSER